MIDTTCKYGKRLFVRFAHREREIYIIKLTWSAPKGQFFEKARTVAPQT